MDIKTLRGLKASDRTAEEQSAINQQMGYKEKPKEEDIKIKKPFIQISSEKLDVNKAKRAAMSSNPMAINTQDFNARIKKAGEITAHLGEVYKDALSEYQEQYGVGRNTINSNANDFIDKISSEVSSYYKKYHNTDKLLDSDPKLNKKKLAAEYLAKKKAYGEDAANVWLDKQYKNIVGENQSWWEQAMAGAGHLIPSIEGGAVELLGNIYGTLNPIISLFNNNLDLPDNENLNWWHNYWNNIIDNPITRYGRDIEMAGASPTLQGIENLLGLSDESADDRIANMKASATKYNPEGIGSQAIVTTEGQDNSLISSATPWQALQSGGFTTLSMLVGGGLAKSSQMLFNGLTKGATYLNKANKLIKTEQALEKTLEGLKKVQNFTDITVIPGLTGGTEGMMEGLNTKIQVEQDAVRDLDEGLKKRVMDEVEAIYNSEANPMVEVRTDAGKALKKAKSREQIFAEVWDKYKDAYADSRDKIDYASSIAGVQNMWANSLINGMLNSTLKAGLQSSRVQEALRNSKLFGWAYRNPKFQIAADGTATPKASKLGTVLKVLKEPAGEGLEEYLQSLSNDTFSGAAENNINEFVKARFNGDSSVKITDTFSSDWAAAATAFYNSLTDKESIQSAILGAVSSAMGTVAMPGRGYHKDDKGNLVQNGILDRRNLWKGLKEDGTKESTLDYVSRITPWRSSVISAYKERKQTLKDAKETASMLTEWLQDPKNREKWDGLTGTASWINQMQSATESNDQFSYRKAQMGKAVNDIMMLSRLKGTAMYDVIVTDLQRSADMDVNSEQGKNLVAKMRAADSEGLQGKSDNEILEKIQSNANKMLGLMSSVENEGKHLDRLLGRVDDNTKQSLIFGKIMEQDFSKRYKELEKEIDAIKGKIQSSKSPSNANIDDELKSLIISYGSINAAIKEESKLQEQKKKAETKVAELQAIDKSKRSDKQNEDLKKSQLEVQNLNQKLSTFEGLYEKDAQGKRMKDLVRKDLVTLVLNEDEIMNLDARTRGKVLASGATRLYNATHQNRQKVDALNEEIDGTEQKIETLQKQKQQWTTADGKVKKGHNKQVQKNNKAIEQLEKDKYKKMRELDAETGDRENKPIYSSAQQEVIDNLIQQGSAEDKDFLDKVADMGRLQKGIKDYHQQYQAVLSDPNAFNNYVKKAKYRMTIDLTRRRAERVADMEDFKEFSKELNKLTANASPAEMFTIFDTLKKSSDKKKRDYIEQKKQENIDKAANAEQERQTTQDETEIKKTPIEAPETNFDRYVKNQEQQDALISQFPKNQSLTDNDMSLLINAMQYLQQEGVDITDREAAVQALLEKDDAGIMGGKFRQWVEERNANVSEQQQAHMPLFTSIGQVVNQYVEILNGVKVDEINRSNANPTVVSADDVKDGVVRVDEHTTIDFTAAAQEEIQSKEEKSSDKKPGIFGKLGNNSVTDGQFVDNNGTVATAAAVEAGKQKQKEKDEENTPKTDIEEAFGKVTTPELAKSLNMVDNLLESMVFTEDGKNVSLTDEEKKLARQSLLDIAVDSDETFDTMDEIVSTIMEKVDELHKQQDMMEDEKDKKYGHAAGLLKSLATRLKVSYSRKRVLPVEKSRAANTQSSIIHSADIAWIASKNKDAWAVKFTEEHAIDEYIKSHNIAPDTPVYFITDSSWTAEVTKQMDEGSRKYDTLTDMPLVAAVEVETPKNADTTTAIQIKGKWYQPIAIMPSTKSVVSGASRTQDIRRLASKEQGTHIVTENGTPNDNPLVSYITGKNYIDARHPDDKNLKRDNNESNNSKVLMDILDTLPTNSAVRLLGLSKKDMISDPEYIAARERLLSRLSWGEGYVGSQSILNNQLLYTPDDLKNNEGKPSDKKAQPMIFFIKPLAQTTARESDKTLSEVLKGGNLDEIVTFNSRTQRLFNEVIRPLFEHMTFDNHADRSARVVTQEDLTSDPNAFDKEAERLTTFFNGYDGTDATKGIRGINEYLFISPKAGYKLVVTAPSALQTVLDLGSSKSVYKIFLVNTDTSEAPIELGTITAQATKGAINQDNIEAAKEMLKNLLKECSEGVLKRSSHWQVAKATVNDLQHKDEKRAAKARQNIGSMIDDGIFELSGSSLEYQVHGLEFKAPISTEGRIVYPANKIVNGDNAKLSAPINTTPQGEGSTVTQNGTQVDTKSGAVLDNPPAKPKTPQMSEAEKKAKCLTEKIVEDSKQFTLSEDETYYYITDKNTGERVKYLRVTTVIGADDSVIQWFPSVEQLKEKLGKDKFNDNATKLIDDLYIGNEDEGKNYSNIRQKDIEKIYYYLTEKDKIAKEDIDKAIAELRTEHKKHKFEGWGVPSTAIGNTADVITRDFFAGELKDHYPNISDSVLEAFKNQLAAFKNDLDSRGIKIVSQDVMAHGKITVTKADGTTQDVNVAGTLDLFGYDDKGNFYIFDMKTTRNHTPEKLQNEKAKWSRQVSMYADLLSQSYPDFKVSSENLRIIPINVGYPSPKGKGRGMSLRGPVYSVTDEGQLQMTFKEDSPKDFVQSKIEDFEMRGTTLQEQFQPGYTHVKVSWDNLSSEDQEIASSLEQQVKEEADNTTAPAEAEVKTTKKVNPYTGIMSPLSAAIANGEFNNYNQNTEENKAEPIHSVGETQELPTWDNLSDKAKEYIKEEWGQENRNDFLDFINNPADKEALRQDLGCHGLI